MSKQSTQHRLAQINGVVAPQTLNEAFTKQHYIAIAKIFADWHDEIASAHAEGLVNDIADLFAQDNGQFRREQFLKACGVA